MLFALLNLLTLCCLVQAKGCIDIALNHGMKTYCAANNFQCDTSLTVKAFCKKTCGLCEEDTDDCEPNPCKNEGICTDGEDSYTCACKAGYRGDNCDKICKDTSDNWCHDKLAMCETSNNIRNECPVLCGQCVPKDFDDCASVPCKNGGNCTDGDDSFECACAAGYEGDTCATNTDNCADVTCDNGGVCRDGVDSYECACALGYTGRQCEPSGFIQHQGKHISWGTPQDSAVTSVAACAKLCGEDDKCGFFDFNYGFVNDTYEGPYQGVACWLHDKSKTLEYLTEAYMYVICYEKTKEEEE